MAIWNKHKIVTYVFVIPNNVSKCCYGILGEIKKELCSVEEDNLKNRINDAKCDSSGRVWFGTMARKPVYREDSGASLYCYSKRK